MANSNLNTNKQQSALTRRTSSLAYDNGRKEKYSRVDLWRKRLNLSPNDQTISTTTSLSTTSASSAQEVDNSKPIYTFGVLTDIQYAPIPDGHSYGGNPRYYRHAKIAAEHAAKHFEEEQVKIVINLGDIVDGKCSDIEKWGGEVVEEEMKINGGSSHVGHDAIDDVLDALSSYKSGRVLHTYGNHELYNLSREDLGEKLSIPFTEESNGELVGYYDHLLHEPEEESSGAHGLRFIILDSYDICLLGRCAKTSSKRRKAVEIMRKNNPSFPRETNSPEGLEGVARRFVGFNGAVDSPQKEWLQQSLQLARENGERVIICSHQPIHPESSFPTCLMWNYDEVLEILRKFSDVVIASFCGHAHAGGYCRDEESGIHFRSFEAVLESNHPIRTYAMIDIHDHKMEVRGWGDCVSDVFDLDHLKVGMENTAQTKA